jgi:aryl-alcohol dehydrogenase-like predicted oxidoreductase
MALAYAASRPFMTSVIIGVTSVEQLACNLASLDLTLSEDVLEGIEAIHAADPNPAT